MDQADGDVCDNLGWAALDELVVEFVTLWRFASELADEERLFGIF